MAFDVLIHIAEDTQRGRAIQRFVEEQHVTPEQAVEQLIEAGIQARAQLIENSPNGKTPAEMLLGLFSNPEDAALMDEVIAIAYEGRGETSTRSIGL